MKKKNNFSWNLDILSHHGILGQRKGVRNGPPYPLDYDRHSDRQKQAAKDGGFQLGKSSGRYTTAAGTSDYIKSLVKSGNAKVRDLDKYAKGLNKWRPNDTSDWIETALTNSHDNAWEERIELALDDNLNIATGDNVKEYRSYNVAEMMRDNPHLLKNFSDERNSAHARGQITDEDLISCNPGYGKPGTTQNCTKSSAAIEAMQRGYNVQAGRQTYPSSSDALSHWFKGAKQIQLDTDVAEDAIKSFGKKTSGEIGIRYPDGITGHAMHWTVDDSGNFEIQDGQNARRFSSLSSMMSEYGADSSRGVDVTRLDNCEMNYEAMAQDSVYRVAANEQSYSRDTGYATYIQNRVTGKVVRNW